MGNRFGFMSFQLVPAPNEKPLTMSMLYLHYNIIIESNVHDIFLQK